MQKGVYKNRPFEQKKPFRCLACGPSLHYSSDLPPKQVFRSPVCVSLKRLQVLSGGHSVSATSRLVDRIQHATRTVVRQMSQDSDSISQAVVGRDGDRRLIINSSFLSRDLRSTAKTHQSSRRLAAQLIVTGKQVGASTIGVMDDRQLKGHNKILPSQDTN